MLAPESSNHLLVVPLAEDQALETFNMQTPIQAYWVL